MLHPGQMFRLDKASMGLEMRGGGGGGGGGGESDEAFAVRQERHLFDFQQMQDRASFNLEQFHVAQRNAENKRTFDNLTARNAWADKEAIRIFDYKNQIKAYNASVDAYHEQLDYNALAEELSTNDSTRKYNERLTQIGFQNEEIVMKYGAKREEAIAKTRDTQLNALAQRGKLRAMGQTGRGARKNMQSILAEEGRATDSIVDFITREERQVKFGQRQLAESMKSARGQYDADQQQIKLQRWGADMAAEAKLAPEPTLKPQMTPPLAIPGQEWADPPTPPSKEQWQNMNPVQGQGGGGGGGGFLGAAATIMSFIPGPWSDDRLKRNYNRVGTSKSGIHIYTFKYIADGGHGPTYKGTSAQDLIAMGRKDAVGQKEKNGFYYVDYSKLDVEFEKVQPV